MHEHDQSATPAAATVLALQLCIVIQSLLKPVHYQVELDTKVAMTTLFHSTLLLAAV